MVIAVEVIQCDHRVVRSSGREAEEMMTCTLATHFRHKQTRLLRESLFGIHHIGGIFEHMLREAFLLIPCNRFLALRTCLEIHTSVHKEGVLTAVVSLMFAGTGVTVFGCRIGITETGLPVLARTHIVVESGTEQLSPVNLLLTPGVVELDIVRFRQLLVALQFPELLRVFPALRVRPKGMTLLEVIFVYFFLQLLQMLQIRRIEHLQIVLVIRGVIQLIVSTYLRIGQHFLDAFDLCEVLRLTEQEELLELLVLQRAAVTTDVGRVAKFLVLHHLTSFLRIFVLTVDEFGFRLLKLSTFYQFLEFKILRQFRGFLDKTIAFFTLLHVINELLECIR